jgi:hypothetical protein
VRLQAAGVRDLGNGRAARTTERMKRLREVLISTGVGYK